MSLYLFITYKCESYFVVKTCDLINFFHWSKSWKLFQMICLQSDEEFQSVFHHYVSSVQFSSVQFSSVQFSSVQFSSVQFSSVQFSSVQFSSVQFSSVQFSSVQFSFFSFQCGLFTVWLKRSKSRLSLGLEWLSLLHSRSFKCHLYSALIHRT